jgi:hypothetical protein
VKKFMRFAVVLLACSAPALGNSQVAAYGTFSVTTAQNLVTDNTLYGATTGLLLTKFRSVGKFDFGADLQGRFVHADNFSLNGITFGPRVQLPQLIGLRPYAEFLVGFARVQNTADSAHPSTDSTIQINGGVMKRITPHVDLVGEFSYSQLYAFGGEYNPKTFSVGGIYHFSRRDK